MATGTQLMKEISDQFLVCKICLEPFKDPKTLSCLHTFCCACVQEQYDAESSARSTSTRYTSLYAARAVTCPVCRKKTDLPTGGVRRLPDNFLVSNLTNVLAKRRCVSKVPPCEICHTVRSRSSDACSKCLDCDKLLCRSCVELHSSTKVTQGHSLIDLEGQKDIECKTHPEETVRFYCEKCEECICVVCTFQEHKDHDVCSFNDGFSKHKSCLEDLLTRSRERMEDVSRRLKVIDKVETLSKELKERIRDLAISYTSQVRAREKELIRQVDEVLNGGEAGVQVRQLSEKKAWLQDSLDSLQSAAQLTEIVVRDKGVEMLLLKKEIQEKLGHLLTGTLPPEPPDLPQFDLTFVPGEVKLGDIFIPGEEKANEEQEVLERQKLKTQSLKKKNNNGGEVSEQNHAGPNDAVVSQPDPSSAQSPSLLPSSLPDKNSSSTKLPADWTGTNENVVMTPSQPCRACLKRKRQEEREEKRSRTEAQTKKERRRSTRSVCIQTILDQTTPTTTAAKEGTGEDHNATSSTSSSTVGAHLINSAQNHTAVPPTSLSSSSSSACNARSDEASRLKPPLSPQSSTSSSSSPSGCRRARGTMTTRLDVRTLKVQTEDSCLRDAHLDQAAAAGSSYPNTGGAIAAAFLRHKATTEEEDRQAALTRSWPVGRSEDPFSVTTPAAAQTRDAGVATDISLGLAGRSTADTVTALTRQGEGLAGGMGPAVNGADLVGNIKPDLLAEAGMLSMPPASSSSSSSSSRWIRSRKVQTDISAVDSKSAGEEGQCIIDGEMKRALFLSSGGNGSTSQSTTTTPAVISPPSTPILSRAAAPRASTCDVGVMTPFKVKLVKDSVDTATEMAAVTSLGVGVMTSPDTKTVYIQTLLKKLRTTAAGTDYEGQRSTGVSTQPVSSVDAETAMPPVTQESRTTWTDALVTSERATSATGPETFDASTLTAKVQTRTFCAQMRPRNGDACTNTAPPAPGVHRQTQAMPVMVCRGTVPDSSHLTSEAGGASVLSSGAVPSSSSSSSSSALGEASTSTAGGAGGGSVPPRQVVDRATWMVPPQCVTVASGPNSQMFSFRTTSTDTVNLLQVSEKETGTPTVKTVDEWTHTPQPQMIHTGVTPLRPAHREAGVATCPVTLMDQATYTEVRTFRDSATDSGLVVCDSETLTERTPAYDAQTFIDVVMTETQSTSMEKEDEEKEEEAGSAKRRAEGSCMTEKEDKKGEKKQKELKETPTNPPPPPAAPPKETHDSECQCQTPTLVSKEMNTTRYRRKVKEVQTSFSYVECLLCQHPDKLEQLSTAAASAAGAPNTNTSTTKTFTDTSTDPSPPDVHDVATMALSCLASPPGLVHTGSQTSSATLYDKGVATSFDFDDEEGEGGEGGGEFNTKHRRPPLGLECQDAATSTESLPYIGLLSEIDVDELIVIPEANFELVSDSDVDSVSMVDDETLTEVLNYVEVGTQTVLPLPESVAAVSTSPEHAQALSAALRLQEDLSKHLVSVGVNTVPKVTFEKETSTPIRHLFSKGTMTFFVAKMDKATSTISQIRPLDPKQGPATPSAGRVVREPSSRQRPTDSKDTMTTRTEHKDMAVETDSTLMDGRITQCISKLRSVSERLNSPTLRKTGEGGSAGGGDMFFGQSFYSQRSNSSLTSPTSPPQYLSSPTMPARDSNVFLLSPPREVSAEEAQRQTQLQNLLVETDAVLKSSKDAAPPPPPPPAPAPGVRKAQPITTLKTPSPDVQGDFSNYASKSFPRPRSLERQNRVKMGSQATSPNRMPLSRYNSAPGRIATVPAQTLLLKTGQTSPRGASPSKIPVCQKPTAITVSSPPPDTVGGGPDSEPHSTSPTQKVQQRPSLPSISETRTPSSCSETSCVSMEFEDASMKPASAIAASADATSQHSRTPSNVTSVSDTVVVVGDAMQSKGSSETLGVANEALQAKGSSETLSIDFRESNEDDSSSVSSATAAFTAGTPAAPGTTSASPGSSGKQKKEKKEKEKKEKEKKGFMQRFLPGKKKKDTGSSDQEKEGASKKTETESPRECKPQTTTVPPSPKVQKKTKQEASEDKTTKGAKPKKSSKKADMMAATPAQPPAQPRPPPPSSASSTSPRAVEAAAAAASPSTPVSTSAAPAASRPTSSDSSQLSLTKGGAMAPVVLPEGSEVDGPPAPAMPPHHYPPLPDPTKSPPPPRKPRPFVYVRQRIMSIQQDNVEEVKERKEKEKEEKEKEMKENEDKGHEEKKEQDGAKKEEDQKKKEEKEKGKQEAEEKEEKKNEKDQEKDQGEEKEKDKAATDCAVS